MPSSLDQSGVLEAGEEWVDGAGCRIESGPRREILNDVRPVARFSAHECQDGEFD